MSKNLDLTYWPDLWTPEVNMGQSEILCNLNVSWNSNTFSSTSHIAPTNYGAIWDFRLFGRFVKLWNFYPLVSHILPKIRGNMRHTNCSKDTTEISLLFSTLAPYSGTRPIACFVFWSFSDIPKIRAGPYWDKENLSWTIFGGLKLSRHEFILVFGPWEKYYRAFQMVECCFYERRDVV